MNHPATALELRHSLSEILLSLYAAEGLDDFRTRALSLVRQAFGGELTCHNEINLVNGDTLSALSDSIGEFPALRPAFFEHVEQHPSVQHILKSNGSGTIALKTSDFVSQRRWRNSGIYADFYRPLADVRFQLTIGQRIGDWLIFFAVSRKHRDFSESDRDLLTSLRPHFIQAYRNAATRSELAQLRTQAEVREAQRVNGDATVFALMTRFEISRREAQVLHEITQGKSNDDIAQTLGISLSTVKTRLENIFRQMGVRSRTSAAVRALKTELATKAVTEST